MIIPQTITVGGIPTARVTREELTAIMVDDCLSSREQIIQPRIVIASNGSVVAEFHSQPSFRRAILEADIVDADGMPLIFASKLLCRDSLPERIATTDFIGDAADAAAKNGIKFFFLGGRPGVAEKAAERLRAQYPNLQIVGCRDGYFEHSDIPAICREIVREGTDVLWVGLGSPLQEIFAADHRHLLSGVAWIRTCGGLFDHCIGRTRRAPEWIQGVGMEWLFRLVQEPRRLGKRYLKSNPLAAIHLLTKTSDRRHEAVNTNELPLTDDNGAGASQTDVRMSKPSPAAASG